MLQRFNTTVKTKGNCAASRNAVVTSEITLDLFQNYFTGLLQLMNILQHVHCR